MSRGVELRDDSDAPQPGELYDLRHVLLGVDRDSLVPGALLAANTVSNKRMLVWTKNAIFIFIL